MIVIDDPHDARIAIFRMRDRALNTRAHRRASLHGAASREDLGQIGDTVSDDDDDDDNIIINNDNDAALFIAEGDLVVERALAAGCTPVAAFVDIANPPAVVAQLGAHTKVYAANQDVRRVGMGLGVPLSVVALFRRPDVAPPGTILAKARIVALEAVDNPVNVGTVIRSAAALGWGGLLLDRTSADPLARRALRVSMGNTFVLPYARAEHLVDAVTDARNDGVLVVAMTPTEGSVPLHAVRPGPRQRVMLVIGSERTGLSAELLDAASMHASIPMAAGVDSINAAAAAAIACYALRPNQADEVDEVD